MIRVGIIGATGYTAVELIEILLKHPEVSIEVATSRSESPRTVADEHGRLRNRIDLELEDLDAQAIAKRVDCAFSCLPHAASAPMVSALLDEGVKVVDLSADYRLTDLDVYRKWYEVEHPDPDRFGSAAYGLPELFRDEIIDCSLVANPGCFPTSAVLGVAPLIQHACIELDELIFDSKTGVSGAGRKPKQAFHFPECNESVMAYNVGRHRHTPEIKQLLTRIAGEEVGVLFIPHLIPMDRGILTTSYARATKEIDDRELLELFREFYRGCPFIRVSATLPTTKDCAKTNYCDISPRRVGDRIVVVSCIDNLIKGASGAAVQNMNLMYEFDETTALLD
jgi:N-acetyl-gamma-glutamyl-phosphate reductase